ncbi:uncharacterized protein PHALS_06754 [Plasmopara halstedii]|uniref:Uncharacterized protein n=1 Tax=Plasmopara halstedii TaxID=4781 RepID=A0A0P1B4S6_PLAHL|nr:uncharacterized protein PHALS_06754 [Plasmopara halstedii]CEG48964.1 hypothetical protein PHALS_06754 [Plasmopara halstedii]|eukprot:XP_024585333.1 hypothetical protein PHALS_06754 [Plasmopara halstedii]
MIEGSNIPKLKYTMLGIQVSTTQITPLDVSVRVCVHAGLTSRRQETAKVVEK